MVASPKTSETITAAQHEARCVTITIILRVLFTHTICWLCLPWQDTWRHPMGIFLYVIARGYSQLLARFSRDSSSSFVSSSLEPNSSASLYFYFTSTVRLLLCSGTARQSMFTTVFLCTVTVKSKQQMSLPVNPMFTPVLWCTVTVFHTHNQRSQLMGVPTSLMSQHTKLSLPPLNSHLNYYLTPSKHGTPTIEGGMVILITVHYPQPVGYSDNCTQCVLSDCPTHQQERFKAITFQRNSRSYDIILEQNWTSYSFACAPVGSSG